MKNLCIIQARMGSTRLPNKVLMEVNKVPLLEYEINRVKRSKKIDKIVLATGVGRGNDPIEELCQKIGIDCFRGSEDDVLDRFYQCSQKYPEYDNIIRITGDCPLIDPVVIDQVIQLHETKKNDLTSNVEKETFPDGMDVEILSRVVLEEAAREAKLASEREHATQYIRKNTKYSKGNLISNVDLSRFRLTVDNQEDFEVVKFLIENSHPAAGYQDYIAILTENPQIANKNMHISRNEGLLKSLKEDFIVEDK